MKYDEVASVKRKATSVTCNLVFAYDCDTTGLSIYIDHIKIAAEVVQCRSCAIHLLHSSETSQRTPAAGVFLLFLHLQKARSPSMKRRGRPLSVVLPDFVDWLLTT